MVGDKMKKKDIESVVIDYIKEQTPQYAIMINGDWGSGKTYFYMNTLCEAINKEESIQTNKRKCMYISLYGLNSVEQISKQIVFGLLGEKHRGKIEGISNIISTMSRAFTASLGKVNIDISSMGDLLSLINTNKLIICFDDLERLMLE